MTMLTYSLSIIICIIYLATNAKSFTLKLILFLFIAYLIGIDTQTPDTVNYYIRYSNVRYGSFSDTYEPGYYLIQAFSYNLGLSFVEFRVVFSFLALLLIDFLVKKVTSNKCYLFYFFYLCFYVFIDHEQYRNFLSFSIVIYGLSYLLYSEDQFRKVIYIICVFVAASIHVSALAYLPLLLVDFKNDKLLMRSIVLVTSFSCVFILLTGGNLAVFKMLIQFAADGDSKVAAYGENKVQLGFLYPIVMHFISLLFIYLCLHGFDKVNVSKAADKSLYYSTRLIFKINLVSFLFFPLYMFHLQFIRLGRGVFFINLILFSAIMLNSKFKEFRFLYAFLGGGLLLISLFSYTYIIGDHVEDILIPFFDDMTVTKRNEG